MPFYPSDGHLDDCTASMRNAVCLLVSLFKHPDNGAASKRIAVCLFISR